MNRVRLVVYGLILLVVLVLVIRASLPPSIEAGSALVLELSGDYVEAAEPPRLMQLLGFDQRSFVSVLSELRKAERDDRLGHVVLRVRDLDVGWAKAQELRRAILALREAGRHTVALLEVSGFGANKEYYVASAAHEIHLAPGGGPPLLGLAQEYLFLGGLWEKAGVRVEVAQAGTYKGALESYTGRAMSDAYREQAEGLLDAVDAQFVQGIAEARDLAPERVREVLAAAPSDPEALLGLGLVDAVSTRAELLEALGDPPVVEAGTYARIEPSHLGFEPAATFALVHGSGAVVTGGGRVTRTGQPVLAADTVVEALEQAAQDDSIRAIVLRVDSPGGGPFPSELVWRAIRKAREEKPVVATFSDYAASGGYYLASAADAIVANPATLTGSIGVFAIRSSLGGVLERFDVGTETLVRSPHADLLLLTQPLSEGTRAWLQNDVELVYRRFLSRVAEGRGLEVERVGEVAEGRIWTGAQALELGLVDALGGLREAVGRAKEQVGLDADADVALAVYPPPRTLVEQLQAGLGAAVAQQLLVALPSGDMLERIGPWLQALLPGGPLLVPPLWVEIH